MTLSDKGNQHGGHEDSYVCYSQGNVRKFIWLLKQEIILDIDNIILLESLDLLKKIDKLAGKELI